MAMGFYFVDFSVNFLQKVLFGCINKIQKGNDCDIPIHSLIRF